VSATTVSAGTTYHVVGTYDGSNMRIYVNGVLESTFARSSTVNDSTFGGVLASPGWGTLPSPAFQGQLDEIAIYGTALSPTRIQIHFNVGTDP
jgi:Concanavalin A-like lectin/glucanases superfamily